MIFALSNRQNTQRTTSSFGSNRATYSFSRPQQYSSRRHVYTDDGDQIQRKERENYQAKIQYRNRLLTKVMKYKTKNCIEQEKEQAEKQLLDKIRLLTIVDTDNFIKQRKVKQIEIRKSLCAWRAFCGIQICYIILAILTAYYDAENESQWNCLQNIFTDGSDCKCDCIHSYGFVFRCLMCINFFPCFWIGFSSKANELAIRSILKRHNRLKMLFSYTPVLAIMGWVIAVIIRVNILLSGQCSEYTKGTAVQTSSIFGLFFIIFHFICMAVEVMHDLHHKIRTRWCAKQLGNEPPIYDLSTDEEPDIEFVENQIKRREQIYVERRNLARQRIEERDETRLQNNIRQNLLLSVLPPDEQSQVESIRGLPSPELPIPQILAPDPAAQIQMDVVEQNNKLDDYIQTLQLKNYEMFQSEYDGYAPFNECVVCQEPFTIQGGDNLIVFECDPKHYMHRACGIEWLKRHPNCPLCRADFTEQIKQGYACQSGQQVLKLKTELSILSRRQQIAEISSPVRVHQVSPEV